MPRDLPSGLLSLLKSGYAETHSTLVISLVGPGRSIKRTIYLATCEETQGGGVDSSGRPRPGVTYLPRLRQTGPVSMSLTATADRCDVTVENIDKIAGIDFVAVQDQLYGSFAEFGRLWRDLRNPTNTYFQTLLTGQIIGARASEQEVTLTIVSDIFSSGAIAGQILYSRSCPWTFKDPATCAFVGAESTCNKLLNDPGGCSGRNNKHHFGGFPYIDSQATVAGAAGLQANTFNQTVLVASSSGLAEGADARATTVFLQRHNLLLQGFTVTDDPVNDATRIASAGGSGGHIIADEGVPLASEPTLNFTGAGVVASDNSGAGRTDVLVQTADLTHEGCVSITAQNFAGFKSFWNGVKVSGTTSDPLGVPLVVEYTNLAVNGHIQEWWPASGPAVASLDTQGVLRLGIPQGMDGVLQLCAAGSGNTHTTELHANATTQDVSIWLPLNFPTAGQVLSVQVAYPGNGRIFTQWSTVSTAAGGYTTVADETVSLTPRSILNFTGPGVVASDNTTSGWTDVLVQTADLTHEGCVSISAQNFAGFKSFWNAVKIYSNGFDPLPSPLTVQYTGSTFGTHIQEWWIGGSAPIAYIDTQPTLRLGQPSTSSNPRAGFIELAADSAAYTVTLGCATGATANQLLRLPPAPPTAQGQVLSVFQFGAGGANLQWSTITGGHIIADEGVPLGTQRGVLNFKGPGVLASDNSTSSQTDVLIQTASSTSYGTGLEGTVSTVTQQFAGFKFFNTGMKVVSDGTNNPAGGIPLIVQYSGGTVGAYIQQWWIGGSYPLAYIDSQPYLRIGGPSDKAARDGFLELCSGGSLYTLSFGTTGDGIANYLLRFPAKSPTAIGQVLSVLNYGPSGANLQWSTPATGIAGHAISDEGGAALAQQPTLNFTGPGVVASNNAGSSRTDVLIQTADLTHEGCVSITAQNFAGFKSFWNAVKVSGTTTDPLGVPLTVQYTGADSAAHIQDWLISSSIPIAYLDVQAKLRLGSPSGSGNARAGFLELCSDATSFTVQLGCNTGATANQLIKLPAAMPTANGQVLSVASFGGGQVNLQWSTAASGSGVTGTGTMTANRLTRWITPGATGTIADSGFGDDGTSLTMYRSLVMGADGTLNIGDGTNRVGAIYLKNAFFVYTVGGTTSNPKAAGFLDPGNPGGNNPECTRLLISGNQSVAQGGFGQRTSITAYYGLELRGSRLNGTAPAFVAGSTSDPVVSAIAERDITPFRIDSTATISSANNLLEAKNVGVDKFHVNAAGSVWSDGGMRYSVALIQAAAGANVDLNNYLNYHTLILDTVNGSFTVTLPLLTAALNGTMWRFICNRRTSSSTVTIKCQAGNDINETTSGASTGWTLTPNAGNTTLPGNFQHSARDALVVGDATTNEWWISNLTV